MYIQVFLDFKPVSKKKSWIRNFCLFGDLNPNETRAQNMYNKCMLSEQNIIPSLHLT